MDVTVLGCLISMCTKSGNDQQVSKEFSFHTIPMKASITIRLNSVVSVKLKTTKYDLEVSGVSKMFINGHVKPLVISDFQNTPLKRGGVSCISGVPPGLTKCIVNVEFNKILFGKPAEGLSTLLDGGRITSLWFTDSLASNSQTYISSLMNNLSKSTTKDFDLVVQETLAKATPTVTVHKIILSATSPVFREALLALPPGDDSKLTLDLRNITEAGLQAFVNFMYGSLNKVDLVTYRDELFAISSKFAVTALYECCMDLYRVDLNSRNLLSTLKLAAVVGSTDLQTLCIDFLSLNIEDIKEVESFIREGYCSAQGFDSCCKVKDVKAEEVKDVKREFDSHCQVKDVKAEEVKDVKVKREFDAHCQVKDVKEKEVKDVKVKREFDSHCQVKLKRPKW